LELFWTPIFPAESLWSFLESASHVCAPTYDPKDIDTLETERGSYASDLGERTYGVFDVLPRNGFAFNRSGEATLYAGNLYTGEAQVSLGDHSQKSAWYTRVAGNRSNYGLATPLPQMFHVILSEKVGVFRRPQLM